MTILTRPDRGLRTDKDRQSINMRLSTSHRPRRGTSTLAAGPTEGGEETPLADMVVIEPVCATVVVAVAAEVAAAAAVAVAAGDAKDPYRSGDGGTVRPSRAPAVK